MQNNRPSGVENIDGQGGGEMANNMERPGEIERLNNTVYKMEDMEEIYLAGGCFLGCGRLYG